MSHYNPDELVIRWTREELTTEQMIGQMVQILRAQQQRLHSLERRLAALEPIGSTQSRKGTTKEKNTETQRGRGTEH